MTLFNFKNSINYEEIAIKLGWKFGFFNAHIATSLASQKATQKPDFPVRLYASVKDLSTTMEALRWTEDPWKGKLDVVKHATFVEEALNLHPDYSEDCDGQANYMAVALMKSKLAKECFLGSLLWKEPKPKNYAGHVVCVFKDLDNQWFWISNWEHHKALPLNHKEGWIEEMQKRINKPKILAGKMTIDKILPDDTVVLGKAFQCA